MFCSTCPEILKETDVTLKWCKVSNDQTMGPYHRHRGQCGNIRALCERWYLMHFVVMVYSGTSVGVHPVLVQYHMSLATLLFPQLQLWHLHWLVFIQFLGVVHSQALPCLTEVLLQLLKHIDIMDVIEAEVVWIPVLDEVVCVCIPLSFHHSWHQLRTVCLGEHMKTCFIVMTNSTAEKCVTPVNGDIHSPETASLRTRS
jgi:hypothetical protein